MTTTQQPPSNPAIDFAQGILEETNNGLELIEILYDIAKGADQEANTNDRITAASVLTDRALGKTPRRIAPCAVPIPETDDNDIGALREAPPLRESTSAKSESPRLVTKIDAALHDSLGPAPKSHVFTPQTPDSFDPYSIHFTIQQHILAITNNGETLRGILLEIARACPEPIEGAEEDPEARPEQEPALSLSKGRRVTPYHRRRAATLLLERALGTDPDALRNTVCPDCRRKWTTHSDSSDHPQQSVVEEEPFDEEVWEKIIAELKQKEEDGILHPDPNARKIDISSYLPPEDYVMPPEVAAEGAAKFWAANALRLERRKQWPDIEERRRQKLAQIYPSHSEDKDSEPPDT